MKKLIILSTLAFALSALPAYAATLEFSPATATVAPGDTVSVVVSIAPAGATITAVEAELSYPAALLTPGSFTFAPTWIPVTQSGYDQMSGGTVIKTAGYPGGLTATTTLGTLTFTAVSAGTATITVENSSIAYDTGNHNTLAGTQGSASIIIAPASTTAQSPAPAATQDAAPPQSSNNTLAVSAADALTATSTAATDPAATSTALTAAAANASGAAFLSSLWVWIILALIILAGLGTWLWNARRQA